MDTIKDVLMRRDGLSEEHADIMVEEARDQLRIYLEKGMMQAAEDICQEFFGLEPDYLMELI